MKFQPFNRRHSAVTPSSAILRSLSLIAIACSTSGTVSAATKYYDGAASTVWDNSSPNWGTVSTGPYTSVWANFDAAIFEGAATTVTVNSVSANSLRFNVGGYTLSGGTISLGNPGGTNLTVSTGVTATIASTLTQPYGTGLRLDGGGTLNLSGAGNTNASFLQVDNGTLGITGGSCGGTELYVSSAANTSGSVNISVGTLTLSGGTNSIGTRGNGSFTQSGGTSNFTNTLQLGYYNLGFVSSTSVTLSGGAMNAKTLYVGQNNMAGSSSIFTQTGGTFTLAGGSFFGGSWGGGVQQVNLSGGVFDATAALAGESLVSVRGTASMTISGTADARFKDLRFGHAGTASSIGTLDLNGGTLTSGAIAENVGGHTSTFNFNGGTLKASVSSATYLQGLDRTNVRNGGAIIDTNGKNITIAQNLVHSIIGGDTATDGGLTKNGTGTLTIPGFCDYTGATTINAGKLLIAAGGNLAATSAVIVASNGTLGGGGSVLSSIALAGTIAPGAAAGALFTNDVTFAPGSSYEWDVDDWDGSNPGSEWDLLDASALVFNNTSGNRLTIRIAGAAANFSEAARTFTIATATTGITGFSASAIQIDATAFIGTGTWTVQQNDSSIELVYAVGSGNSYATWKVANAGGQAPGLDFDNDGISNGLEYFMGQTGSSFTASPSVVGGMITWPKSPSAVASYAVQTSTDLTTWMTAVSGVTDNGTSVQYVVPTGDSKRFTRLSVIIP